MPGLVLCTVGVGGVSLLVAASCAAIPARQIKGAAPAAANHSIAPKLTLQGVSNLGEVSPTLYRGGQPTRDGFVNLSKIGISIVVDLRGSRESERQRVTKLGMQYVSIPWHCFHPRDSTFAMFLRLLQENPRKKVFVHCRLGEDRTGMMIAAYRMTQDGWTPEEARAEMNAYGFSFGHNFICPGLASYEKEFPHRFQNDPAFQGLRSPRHSSDASSH